HLVDGSIIAVCDLSSGKHVASGESGQVVVTTFNETYPLIRFGTGDLATFMDARCACGRTSPRIALVGRVGDAVKVRGMFVHPQQLKAALSRFPSLGRAQAIITRPDVRDELVLHVETQQPRAGEGTLAKQVGDVVRELCRVSVDRIEFVPMGSIAADASTMLDQRRWD
ncbi:MAG: phenylacetate--CoA ligase family protein, partial [Chloroflexi bacterium]|nr:phenylacetate--CoA ligase family protein [Chloroflexota bacterium]